MVQKCAMLRDRNFTRGVRENKAKMRIDQAVNIEDLHRMAKRRLPKIAFDFIEGGLEDERGLERNTSSVSQASVVAALPGRCLEARPDRQLCSATLMRARSAFRRPAGAGLFRRGADLMLAEAAAKANIPYIMSGASNDSIEAAAKIAPEQRLVSALCGARSRCARGYDPPHRRCRHGITGIDRRRASQL